MMSTLSMLFSTAHTPIQFLFAGDMSPYSQRQRAQDISTFLQQNNKILFFLHELIVVYEQASTSWLKAFPC